VKGGWQKLRSLVLKNRYFRLLTVSWLCERGMEANACLRCRFGSIRLDIKVPEKYDTDRFARETKRYAEKLFEAINHKSINYALTFEAQQHYLDFNLMCTCILNVKKQDCSNYNPTQHPRVKHLNRERLPLLEVPQRLR
jgi:hypothetical protein